MAKTYVKVYFPLQVLVSVITAYVVFGDKLFNKVKLFLNVVTSRHGRN